MVQRRRKLKVRHFVSGLIGWVSAIAFILWIAARILKLPTLEKVGLWAFGGFVGLLAWMFVAYLIERRWSLSAGRRRAGRYSVIVIWVLLRLRRTIRRVDRWLA
jgi:hypothetical protein